MATGSCSSGQLTTSWSTALTKCHEDKDGRQSCIAPFAVDEWFHDVGTETNDEIDLYNEGIGLANSYLDGVDVPSATR